VEDNQWVLDLAARDPFLLGLVGHLTPGTPEFRDHFERFRKNPLFLGIRVNDQSISDALARSSHAADFRRLADAGLEADVLGSASANLVRFADRFPDLRIVIDHLPFEPGAEGALAELGRRPNVFGKVSGVLRRVDGRVPLDLAFYRPALDRLWETFGPDRLIYGSNWPVCELVAPMAAARKVLLEYFSSKGASASDRFFRKNSQAAYRWKKR
jgi:predicted TIM-barrel fold metal-dependent hydrolase